MLTNDINDNIYLSMYKNSYYPGPLVCACGSTVKRIELYLGNEGYYNLALGKFTAHNSSNNTIWLNHIRTAKHIAYLDNKIKNDRRFANINKSPNFPALEILCLYKQSQNYHSYLNKLPIELVNIIANHLYEDDHSLPF